MSGDLKQRKSERGIVLLVVLIAVAILATLVVDFIYSTQIDTTISANAADEMKAYYIAKSGVEIVAGTMKDRALEELTELTGNAGVESSSPEGFWTINVPSFPVGEGFVSFKVVDERSKINLNALVISSTNQVNTQVLTELTELFRMLEIEDDKSSLFIGSLINWLDRSIQGAQAQNDQDPTGANAGFYAGLDNPYRIKDGPLDSVGEIMLINGMDEEFFNKINAYVTVYPLDGRVNFSTAPKVAMMAALKGAASAVRRPQGETELPDEVAGCIADAVMEGRKEDPVVDVRKVREIERDCNVDPANSISSGLSIVISSSGKSDVFSVTSTGSLGEENPTQSIIEAAIRKSGSQNSEEVDIISWKEN